MNFKLAHVQSSENLTKQNELDQNEFDRNKTICIHIESEREIPAHGDNECNWRLQLPCACTLPSFTNECSYICVYTHGLVELNSGGPSVCQCHAMRCDGMRCHAVCDAMRCDGLTSVWPYTSLNSIGYVCTSYGGCWMTPTSVVWLFWHTQGVSVVVISVSVCAQAVIAAAYMQQPSTSLLRAYANEWVNERTIERTNDRRYQRTNQPTNDATNQRTNKLTN